MSRIVIGHIDQSGTGGSAYSDRTGQRRQYKPPPPKHVRKANPLKAAQEAAGWRPSEVTTDKRFPGAVVLRQPATHTSRPPGESDDRYALVATEADADLDVAHAVDRFGGHAVKLPRTGDKLTYVFHDGNSKAVQALAKYEGREIMAAGIADESDGLGVGAVSGAVAGFAVAGPVGAFVGGLAGAFVGAAVKPSGTERAARAAWTAAKHWQLHPGEIVPHKGGHAFVIPLHKNADSSAYNAVAKLQMMQQRFEDTEDAGSTDRADLYRLVFKPS